MKRIILTVACLVAMYGTSYGYRDSGGYFTKPVIDKTGNIFVGTQNKCVYSLSKDGAVNWRFKAGSKVLSNPAEASDGSLYFGAGNGFFYALEKDGKLRWSCKMKKAGKIESGSAIGADGTVYVGTSKGLVLAFDQKKEANATYLSCGNAPLKWSLPMPKKSTRIKFNPIAHSEGGKNYIFIGTESKGSDNLGLVKIRDDGNKGVVVKNVEQGDRFRIGGEIKGNALYTSSMEHVWSFPLDLSKENWKFHSKQIHRSHPVVSPDGKTIYQGSREDNVLYALDAATGKKKWAFDNGANIVITAAVAPNGDVYFGDAGSGHTFWAVKPDGKKKWSTKMDHTFRSTPGFSLSGDAVYTGGNTGEYYAFDTKDGKLKWKFNVAADKKNCK